MKVDPVQAALAARYQGFRAITGTASVSVASNRPKKIVISGTGTVDLPAAVPKNP